MNGTVARKTRSPKISPQYDPEMISVPLPETYVPTKEKASSVPSYYGYISICGILGLGLSIYLVHLHYHDSHSPCDINSFLNCHKVNKSEFATLFGVPVAVWGILWNVMLTVMSMKATQLASDAALKVKSVAAHYNSALLAWCLCGMGFIFYFVGAEMYIGALCLLCTAVHILTLVSTWCSYKLYKRTRAPDVADVIHVIWPWLALALAAAAAILFYFNMYHPLSSISREARLAQQYDTIHFAKCLKARSLNMYGSLKCGMCLNQKALLGPGFEFIEFHECGEGECPKEGPRGVSVYPTWLKEDGDKDPERHEGIQSLSQLAEISGCHLRKRHIQAPSDDSPDEDP